MPVSIWAEYNEHLVQREQREQSLLKYYQAKSEDDVKEVAAALANRLRLGLPSWFSVHFTDRYSDAEPVPQVTVLRTDLAARLVEILVQIRFSLQEFLMLAGGQHPLRVEISARVNFHQRWEHDEQTYLPARWYEFQPEVYHHRVLVATYLHQYLAKELNSAPHHRSVG